MVEKRKYCHFHQIRIDAGVSLDASYKELFSGPNNPRWNGGIADYPNHSEFKRARKRVLEKANYKCNYCGEYANEAHHKDGTKHNHTDENLEPLCHKCHFRLYHSGIRHTSKFTKLYGANLKELARQLGCSVATVSNLHNKGILHERLEKVNQLVPV